MPFPDQIDLIRDLVHDHEQMDDEPLLVAVYFASGIAPHEECLFEIVRHFGLDEAGDDGHIFQVQFGPTPNFELPVDGRLRLFMTNPTEFRYAWERQWPEIVDLHRAVTAGDYRILYRRGTDPESDELLNLLGLQMSVA